MREKKARPEFASGVLLWGVFFCFVVSLFIVAFLDVVINFHLVAEDFGESFYVVGTPSAVYFAVFAKVGFHKVERTVDTYQGVAVWA